jgi:hypothetical protein
MIDDSDVDFAVLAAPGGIVGVIIILVVAYFACTNKEDCMKRHCDRGHPVLTAHECLCLESAK